MKVMNSGDYRPRKRRDAHQRQKNREFRSRIRSGSPQVLFFGDSITRRWEDNPGPWNAYLAGFGSWIFGVGGDRIENALWRITRGPMPDKDPEVIVVMIGTNNLPTDPPERVYRGVCQVIDELTVRHRTSDILVLGILPRNPEPDGRAYWKAVEEVNAGLKSACGEKGHHWLDPGSMLPRKEELVDPAVMPDGLHLNEAGYEMAGPVLRDAIGEILTARSLRKV